MPRAARPFQRFPANSFEVMLADPPWKYATWNKRNPKIERHYRLMTLNAIKALPVRSLAAPNCMLVLWATQAQLHHAFEVLAAWGFKYKTAGAWAKQSRSGASWHFGTGFILRSAAEFFLIGTRGSPKVAVRNIRNLIVAPVREHSRKPDELPDALRRMFPRARRIELFAEERRPGWQRWGKPTGRFQ